MTSVSVSVVNLWPSSISLLLERKIVLDDAVVHDDDSSGAVAMRVSVFFRGAAVRGPARVADAVGAIERLEADDFFQIAQLAFSAANLQAIAIAAYCDSGGIISAIFQPTKSLDDDRYDPLLANVSHDAAHTNAPFFGPGETEYLFCELKIRPLLSERIPHVPPTNSLPKQENLLPPNRGIRLVANINLRGRNETLQSQDWSGRRERYGSLPLRLRSGSGRRRV